MSDLMEVVEQITKARDEGTRLVAEPLGKALLSALGIAIPEGEVVHQLSEAEVYLTKLRMPLAVKAIPDGVAHKSDVDAVAGPLSSEAEVVAALGDMRRRFGPPLLIEHWHDGGIECFIGLSLCRRYGPIVSFGLGGVWVEVLRDVEHRRAPVNPREAEEMIESLRAAPLLRGERRTPGTDISALSEAIATVSRLAVATGIRHLLSEIEINPLSAPPRGAPIALDCSLKLAPCET